MVDFWIGFFAGGTFGMFITCIILGSIINDRDGDNK